MTFGKEEKYFITSIFVTFRTFLYLIFMVL